MKKFLAVLLSVGLVYSPIGTNVWNAIVPAQYQQVKKADAKGYRSPSRSFSPGNNGIRKSPANRSNFNSTNRATNKRNSFFGGGRGLLGGLMLGGLAGLLFGGFLSNMGGFGQALGLIINLLAIYFIIRLVFFFFQRRRQPATANNARATHQNYQESRHANTYHSTNAKTETTTQQDNEAIVLDEGNISNAVISFFTNEKGMALNDVEVVLTYDDEQGYGAEVMQNDRLIERLDHFSLVQAIRYWAVQYANLNPNVGIRFEFSELEGITAVLS